ncbi:MAG: hypothetical protein COB02_08785 [Candidatus Cloacimonadota bacterium]|nr:MAG: hypothetical protein COB02_08785 [Candidatus Cloacimonadota bacterium]
MKYKIFNFLKALFYPKACLVCNISGETFFCQKCFEKLFLLTKCLRCGQVLEDFNCKFCSNLFECDSFCIMSEYSKLQNFVYKNKLEPLYSNSTNFSLSKFIKKIDRNFNDICFVPTRSGSHWMYLYLNEVDKRKVFAPLLKNPLKLSQKLLNRDDRIINSMNLFIRSDDLRENLDSILLIDDVLSTGNSLKSAINELKMIGYKNIFVLIFSYQKIKKVIGESDEK